MSSYFNGTSNGYSTIVIVGGVLGTLCSFAACIGFIICIVCIIKHCNRPRQTVGNGIILQQYPPYPNYVPYNPPDYPSVSPPPYSNEKAKKITPPRPTSDARLTDLASI
ncbi:unnamed protein product [Adineta steineri]|uniref:Cysteine and tyrosine-rich protein 1 n=1 Tax=Adineta steineri TaxID=433720 RepID=A0A814LBX7_9BILA|nr:unnamed protein product [Adineta steineri]CAF3897502.1 unnamed protein product [Adineta steineri]